MYKVLIADDEKIIRSGLTCIIDWDDLGFQICAEASNGIEALAKILNLQPDLVLLDINMPQLSGIEVIEHARDEGYQGTFIILSGYSDFGYAQAAVRLNVSEYLTKPIDEDALTESVLRAKSTLDKRQDTARNIMQYKEKARSSILHDFMLNNSTLSEKEIEDLGLQAPSYQVLLCENYSRQNLSENYSFVDLLQVSYKDTSFFEHFSEHNVDVILLKGVMAQRKFQRFLMHYEQIPEEGSPLDSIFIAYGQSVNHYREIHISYEQAADLLQRRFFCMQGQHTLGYHDLPSILEKNAELTSSALTNYTKQFTNYLQSFNRNKTAETLLSLEKYLYTVDSDIVQTKLFLTDLYLQIKEQLNQLYPNIQIPFPSNSDIILFVDQKFYLYEIIQFFSTQFEMIMNALGNSSRSSVMNDILYYIQHNYHTNLKLETIAPLFGYNSAYLGKLINKKVGMSFHNYVDKLRIEHSIKLLAERDLRVYEIAEQIGYSNVDYFHKKFKKFTGITPAEYRKNMLDKML